MENGLILGLLFLVSCLYCIILEYSERRLRLVTRKTWLTVIIGVAMVMAALTLLIPWECWLMVATAFVVAGLPVVGRSIVNEILHDLETERGISDRP